MRRPAVLVVTTYLAAALVGLVVGAIAVLNLHIAVGLEDGYAAGPAEVLDRSPALAAVDVLILVGTPAVAVVLVGRSRLRMRR